MVFCLFKIVNWVSLNFAVVLVSGLLATGEGLEFLSFSFKYPWVIVQLVLFSLCSAIGQVSDFETAENPISDL